MGSPCITSYYDVLIHEALKSPSQFKHGCVILNKRGLIVSKAHNSYKTHPKQAQYSRKVGSKNNGPLHAEVRALIRALKATQDLYGLIVCRINRTGDLRLSKPCKGCQEAIREAGIEYVWYSTPNGFQHMEVE